MDTYLAYPETKEQADAIKAFFKALGIPFKKEKAKVKDDEDDFFTPEMYKQIDEARQQVKEGKYKTLKTKEDIKNFLGL